MIIRLNSALSQTYYLADRDNIPLSFPVASYRSQIKDAAGDALPLLTFTSSGGPGLGLITRSALVVDGISIFALVFTASKALISTLVPGIYDLDCLNVDDSLNPVWQFDDAVNVVFGVTEP